MLVFKKLAKEIRNIESMLFEDWRGTDELNLLAEKLNALKEIDQYMRALTWLTHRDYKEKVKMYFDTDFDAKECAKHYEYPHVNTWETSMSYAAKKFNAAIGQNTLQIILGAMGIEEVASGLFQFRVRTGKLNLNDFIMPDVVKVLPEGNKDAPFFVKDCLQELKFLRAARKSALNEKMRSLNSEKLAFLVSILEGKDNRYARQRLYIYNFILGGVDSLTHLLELLNESDIDRNQPKARLTI